MLDAYCWPQSAAPGERVDLMVSGTGPTCRVEISRVGADVRVVDVIDDVAVAPQRVPDDVAENGCRWDPTVTLTVGPDWASGFHRVRLTGDDGDTADAFFVVRASEPGDAIVV
ncbi:MAG: N,N-dimethylformamidase beta subunit family domain-containing protein, partial [Actinomycetota bacterium]